MCFHFLHRIVCFLARLRTLDRNCCFAVTTPHHPLAIRSHFLVISRQTSGVTSPFLKSSTAAMSLATYVEPHVLLLSCFWTAVLARTAPFTVSRPIEDCPKTTNRDAIRKRAFSTFRL